jgi:tRNA (guanine-N7-)-methyltransferase
VHSRIAALRSQHPLSSSSSSASANAPPSESPNPHYANISALRTNTMKFLPQLLPRASLTHLFLCFPDPHFKQRKHKARIVSAQLNAEYAYFVRPGGKVYTITDVEELHFWMVRHFEDEEVAGPVRGLWERVSEEEMEADEGVDGQGGDRRVLEAMREGTEEARKVSRNGGRKFVGVWRRRENPPWGDE